MACFNIFETLLIIVADLAYVRKGTAIGATVSQVKVTSSCCKMFEMFLRGSASESNLREKIEVGANALLDSNMLTSQYFGDMPYTSFPIWPISARTLEIRATVSLATDI